MELYLYFNEIPHTQHTHTYTLYIYCSLFKKLIVIVLEINQKKSLSIYRINRVVLTCWHVYTVLFIFLKSKIVLNYTSGNRYVSGPTKTVVFLLHIYYIYFTS